MTPLARQVGEVLVEARRGTGRTRRDVAVQAGLAPNTLRELELGTANPTLGRLERLAQHYGVRLRVVVEAVGAPELEEVDA